MRLLTLAAALLMMTVSIPFAVTQAAAPKIDRLHQLSEALKHLNQIARMLDDPIETIEYGSKGEILFSSGKCSVPVIIHTKLQTQHEVESDAPADYWSEVGAARCTP